MWRSFGEFSLKYIYIKVVLIDHVSVRRRLCSLNKISNWKKNMHHILYFSLADLWMYFMRKRKKYNSHWKI